jgi:drug/metabolite transporter (DMT)-like permease
MNRPLIAPALAGSLFVLVAAVSFGTIGPVSNLAYAAGMTAWGFTIVRSAGGSVILLALAWAWRRQAGWLGPLGLPPRERWALLAAVITAIVTSLALNAAYGTVAVAIAVAGFYTYPFILALVGAIRGDEPITRLRALALILALIGLGAIVSGQLEPGVVFVPLGLVLALIASGSQAAYLLISRRGYPSLPAMQGAGIVLAGGALAAMAAAALSGNLAAALGPLGSDATWAPTLAGAVIGAAVPTVCLLAGVRLLGGTRTGILMLAEPVTGVLLASVVLGQALTLPIAVGIAAIVTGAGLINRRQGSAAIVRQTVQQIPSE